MNTTDIKEHVLDQLDRAQASFEHMGIDHRVIGSIGLASYGIEDPFYERPASDPIDAVPDIDVLVPRSDLTAAREIRKAMERQQFPVKLGLAIPSTTVDMRPRERVSELQLGSIMIPVSSDVFKAEQRSIEGGPIVKTVPVETLRHIYGQLSSAPKYQKKYQAFESVAGVDAVHGPQDMYVPFHEYAGISKIYTSPSQRAINLFDSFAANLTPEQAEKARKVGLRVASMIGWR